MGYIDPLPTLFEPSHRLVPECDPPAEATRVAMIGRSPEERAQFVLDLTIFTDELAQAVATVENMMQRSGHLSAPGGAVVTGDGGTGKSFIKTRMLKLYPPRHSRLTSFVPVAAIQLDETPTPEDAKVAILKALGHASMTKQLTASQRADDVVSGLKMCGTRVVLIDEAHHLQLTTGARRNVDRPAGPLGDYLKGLYDAIKTAFVFLGKPSLGTLFASDGQLSSRWPGTIALNQYALDDHWCALLDTLDQALPMLERADLGRPDIAQTIHTLTRGNFRRLKYFLSEAVRQAARDEHAVRLEVRHLQAAYYVQGLPPPNPFGEYLP